MSELNWRMMVEAGRAEHGVWPARVSVPLPRGCPKPQGFTVRRPDGSVTPAQARTLVPWPDGSPRWVQLDFQATQAGEHLVLPTPVAGEVVHPVTLGRDGPVFEVTVGRMRALIDPDAASPVRRIDWRGLTVTGDTPAAFEAVDHDGVAYPIAPQANRAVKVEAHGAHRLQLSWEAQHVSSAGQPSLHVRFRVEFLAAVEGFSLSYHFFHKLPGQPALALKRIGAGFDWSPMRGGKAVVWQHAYGNIGLSRYPRLSSQVTMHLDRTRYSAYVKDARTISDEFDYPPFLSGVNLTTGSAVGLEMDRAAVTVRMRQFECQRPKTLTVEPGRVAVGIWPEAAGELLLRQGRSARQVFCFRLADPDPEAMDIRLSQDAASDVEPAVAWLDRRDSVHAGATWEPQRMFTGSEPGAAFFSHILTNASHRWETVAEMFHFGDVPDPGYTTSYPSVGRTPGMPPCVFAPNHVAHGMFHDARDLPKVWTNNEYDAIHCVAVEAARTRSLALLRKGQAAARHQLEVDFVHHADHWQQHRSTPAHSYDHVCGTSSIASHQWTQGLYHYYALTGDDDVPEVVRAICDYNILFVNRPELAPFMYFNRELGWALTALVFGYELTADGKYLDAARLVLDKLRGSADRTEFSELKKVSTTSLPQNIASIGGDFTTNTIPMGLKAYHQATGEDWARQLLVQWVDLGLKNFNRRATGVKLSELFPETLCYVCELTSDAEPLRQSLWQLKLLFRGFNSLSWFDPAGGPLSTKQYARLYRGVAPLFSALARAGMIEELERSVME